MVHVLRLQLRQSTAIAPNRVCCNALLAAYARAKVPQWQKVCALNPRSCCNALLAAYVHTKVPQWRKLCAC